ncbi:MAG: asparagine synthetase B, partial [Propionibacteriaceae bacterium]|nr:asparagine synthetase B [Propionibacteriaceae bacterium]
MCGLMGFISTGTLDEARVGQVAEGMVCARHRGPDDTAVWHDDRAIFGFNRLSIIDIEGSKQPLRWGPPDNPDRYAMTFNGEIYNYVELRARLATDDKAVFRT